MENFSKEQADAIFLRAAQYQAGRSDDLSIDELKQAAQAAGISSQIFALAVADVTQESREKSSGQKGFGQRIGKLILFTVGAAWVAVAVAILGMGGKYSFLSASYAVLADKVKQHLDAASATPKFAADEIDLALQKFEGHPLWRNSMAQQSREAQGFWQKAFSPPADPALVRFHDELTELAEEPAPNPQQVTQLIEDYQLDIDDALLNDEDYRLVDTPFRSQIYWEASSDADDMGLLFFLVFAVTISVGVAVIADLHARRV